MKLRTPWRHAFWRTWRMTRHGLNASRPPLPRNGLGSLSSYTARSPPGRRSRSRTSSLSETPGIELQRHEGVSKAARATARGGSGAGSPSLFILACRAVSPQPSVQADQPLATHILCAHRARLPGSGPEIGGPYALVLDRLARRVRRLAQAAGLSSRRTGRLRLVPLFSCPASFSLWKNRALPRGDTCHPRSAAATPSLRSARRPTSRRGARASCDQSRKETRSCRKTSAMIPTAQPSRTT